MFSYISDSVIYLKLMKLPHVQDENALKSHKLIDKLNLEIHIKCLYGLCSWYAQIIRYASYTLHLYYNNQELRKPYSNVKIRSIGSGIYII